MNKPGLKKPATDKKLEAAAPPDCERHDEVYFRHASGPKVGRVLSRGEHGCWVECDGARHQMRWADYHGHKTRVRPEVKVIDQGDDGMLVEDRSGNRRYVSDPINADTPEPGVRPVGGLSKAMTPVVLIVGATASDLAKASGAGRRVAGGQGLSLQVVTDKAGHQTKRWKKTAPDEKAERQKAAPEDGAAPSHGQHSIKNGDRVSFKMGTLSGKGQVVSTGAQGATVKDEEGHPHKVAWRYISEHTAGGRDDHRSAGQAEEAARGESLFTGDVSSLPRRTAQPVKTWDELVTKSGEGLAQYREALGGVAKALGLNTDAKPDDLLKDGTDSSSEGFLFIGDLKGEARAKQKVEAEYGGDYSQLRDMVRATIAVSSMDEIRAAVKAVEAAGLTLAQKPNDRFANPTPEGYRDLNTVVKLPNGMVAELQYHLKPITAAKKAGHKDYEISRSLQAKYGSDAPNEEWSDADHGEFHAAVKRQRDIYDAAWKKASEGVDNADR